MPHWLFSMEFHLNCIARNFEIQILDNLGFTRWNGYFHSENWEKFLKNNREILIRKIQKNGLRRKSYEGLCRVTILIQKRIVALKEYGCAQEYGGPGQFRTVFSMERSYWFDNFWFFFEWTMNFYFRNVKRYFLKLIMNRAKDDQPVAELSLFVSNSNTVILREFTYSNR